MRSARIITFLAFVAVLAVPLLFRSGDDASVTGTGERVIIVTPHYDQIRHEFGIAFANWHERTYGEAAHVVWSTPGGTSEIRKMLQAEYTAALRDGRDPGGNADLMWGGGSYEFQQLRKPLRVIVDGEERSTTITAPLLFDRDWLDERYGHNSVGDSVLYDKDGYWYGTALSGFGIVFNREALNALDVQSPTHWRDLADARLRGWVALVNPGQSGSVTTAFHIILQRLGWQDGWSILRRAGANSRYFSASSTKPPIDIGQGEAAMGVCIDFYGRYQAQVIASSGGAGRVGYIDPAGLTAIDPDPIALLRGAPNEQLARRFVEFTLTDEAQALWQFPAGEGSDLGPLNFELRRLPVKRSFYNEYQDRFVDDVNAFDLAAPIENPNRTMRSFVAVLFQSMVMDVHHELKDAWGAIATHPAYPEGQPVIRAADVDDPTLRRMLELFDAFPDVPGPNEAYALGDVEHLNTIKSGWLDGSWTDADLWHSEASPRDVLRERLGAYFRANYLEVVRLAQEQF